MKGRAPQTMRDRWLVSYADLVTILLACFAATYAASSTPPVPVLAAAKTVDAPRPLEEPPAVAPAPAATAAPTLRERVAPIVAANIGRQITFSEGAEAGSVVIALPESASFPTGSADLALPARAFLLELANALRGTDVAVRIEGHTDTVPVDGGRYRSNWELSTARASAVVAFLIAEASFAPDRLSAAGYAEFHPRVANDTAGNRALNRRVDVVLIER